MGVKRIWLVRVAATWMAVGLIMASPYRGVVKSGGLPLPGATVTATRDGKKAATTTDERGAFFFPDLADGVWTITVEMLGFASLAEQVAVAPVAPSPEWEMKLLSADALKAALNPRQAAVAARRPEAGPAAREQAAAMEQRGFQRLDVTQSADTAALAGEGTIRNEEMADLNQSAANAFIVQGSMSSAAGLPQQNDWHFGGPMGIGLMPGMGGPGMGMMLSDRDGSGAAEGARPGPAMGGMRGGIEMRGGPGGPGGGPPPGGPGGGPGPGFRGPGGGPGGFGGRHGSERARGGRDRRGWQGRPDSVAFGNARRNPRNTYMASAFFNLDNSVWDARTFSVTGANLAKPSYADARAGIVFGGPLHIPKLISPEKRILFMFHYEVRRNRTGVISQPVNMPTDLERLGDFSRTMVQGSPVIVYDPNTGLPFPGNRIPATRINSASAKLLDFFPRPNLPFAARNYQTSWSGSNNSQNLNARVSNVRVGSKDRFDGGIGYQGRDTVSPNLFQFIDTGTGRGINASLGWSRNITARLINNLRYSFSRNRDLAAPYFANRLNVAAALGIAGTSQNPMNWGPPSLSFTNYGGLNDGNASMNRNQTSGVMESLLWVHGKHNMAFGAGYRRQQFNPFADSNGRGAYSFNGSATSLLRNGVAQTGTGYDLADFLLGMPATGSIRYGNPDKYFRGSAYNLFVNDDWRLHNQFSIVAGLRWEYAAPVTELYGRLVNLALAPGFVSANTVVPGAYAPDRNNFSPRLGFAWRPRTNRSLVVRGGYGVYYNTSIYNVIAANMAQQPPFARTLSVASSPANPLAIQTGFLLASSQTATPTYAIDPNYRVGYAQTWTVSVQHDLPLSMFGSIGYLGTKGTRLDQQFLPNSAAPGAVEALLPHGFIYETSNGNSIYHAAQFQLHRRFHSGFMAHASYQFSKSIDNAGTGGRGQGGTPVAQNWLDLSAERGLSSFDARHHLSLQLQYSTAMGRRGGTLVNGWKGALMRDWTVSGNISARSGSPFTAIVGGNRSQVRGTAVTNTVRADATGQPVTAEGMLFNTAAFTAPLPGLWGNAGRNTIPGPATFFLNGSVGRVFRFGDRHSIDLQLQGQNILNHVTITSWSTVLGSNNYGLATGAAGMRRLTANLRFRF